MDSCPHLPGLLFGEDKKLHALGSAFVAAAKSRGKSMEVVIEMVRNAYNAEGSIPLDSSGIGNNGKLPKQSEVGDNNDLPEPPKLGNNRDLDNFDFTPLPGINEELLLNPPPLPMLDQVVESLDFANCNQNEFH